MVFYKTLNGSLRSTGRNIRRTNHKFVAGFHPAGITVKRTSHRIPAGSLHTSGTTTRRTIHRFTAALSRTGAITKRNYRRFTVGLTLSGRQTRLSRKPLSARLVRTGGISRQTRHKITASAHFVGTFPRPSKVKLLVGSLRSTGAIRHLPNKLARGAAKLAGVLTHVFTRHANPAPILQHDYLDVRFYAGSEDHTVPWDIRNQRRSTNSVMQRMGTPVLVKRMYTIEDVENGVAKESPTMDDIYHQSTYALDELSHGVGYVSVETQDGEWYNPLNGDVYVNNVNPDPSFLPAPKYRGYGPGFLTYAILPDRPEDVWKLTPQGTLIRQQTATIQLPWWPQLGDNDLAITCRLDDNGFIAETYERYQLKMVTPLTMRGLDRRGNREFEVNAGGNRFWVGQQSESVKVPTNDQIYKVEVDR